MELRLMLLSISIVATVGCILVHINLVRRREQRRVLIKSRHMSSSGGSLRLQLSKSPKNDTRIEERRKVKYFREPILPFRLECETLECQHNKNISWGMVVFIKSTASNFYRRSLIRRTWGKWRYVEGGLLRVVFVTGKPDSKRVHELLGEESQRNRDILNFDGPDNYRNIAIKTLTGMRWASENLPGHYLYTTGDDDFLIDLGALQETVSHFVNQYDVHNPHGFPIICTYQMLVDSPVVRNNKSKWFVTEKEYRWSTFPRSCLGGMYTTSVGVARLLLEAASGYVPMRVDDVWITGILREKILMPSSMVVEPKLVVARHFVGYRGKRSKNIRGYMQREWEKIYNKFKHKQLCSCAET